MKNFLILLFMISFSTTFAQDIIYKKNGDEINAKVVEISPELIKYKPTERPNGPIYSIYKSEVLLIIYKDGSKDIFKDPVKTKKPKAKKARKVYPKSSFIDKRDGKKYKTIKIGDQVWMSENLNYKSKESWCYDNKPENADIHGRLYKYKSALKSCPDGWHLPSDQEWKKLEISLGMKSDVDETGWRGTSPGQGFLLKKEGKTGFNAELSGCTLWGNFDGMYNIGYYWTSTKYGSRVLIRILKQRASIKRVARQKKYGYSVRCIKDK